MTIISTYWFKIFGAFIDNLFMDLSELEAYMQVLVAYMQVIDCLYACFLLACMQVFACLHESLNVSYQLLTCKLLVASMHVIDCLHASY